MTSLDQTQQQIPGRLALQVIPGDPQYSYMLTYWYLVRVTKLLWAAALVFKESVHYLYMRNV